MSVRTILSALLIAVVLGHTLAIWPKPVQTSLGAQRILLDWNKFTITTTSGQPGRVLSQAIERYYKYTFYDRTRPASVQSTVNTLLIDVSSSNQTLYLGVDESYTLTANPSDPQIKITATTVWGALRALETFNAIVTLDESDANYRNYFIDNAPITIKDKPRFPWRGFMIDTARHYYAVNHILEIIDALEINKFNTLHWHMVDAISFPVVIRSFPKLAEKGSFYYPLAIYKQEEIQQVVDYAYLRGIRVIPEFDVPGHAGAWGFGYPNITADCPTLAANINNIALNVANEFTYEVLEGIVSEMSQLFGDQTMHFGGDEVVQSCWAKDASIVAFMNKMGLKSFDELEGYFETRLEKIYRKHGKSMVCWEEVLQTYMKQTKYKLPTDTIIQAWRSREALHSIISQGFRGLLSAGWYLDKQHPNATSKYYFFQDTWKDFYLNEPTADYSYTPKQLELLLGGEACMWSEQVDDTNFHARVWPRACAVAERLWSPIDVNNVNEATPRLMAQRCRMVRRGIMAGPVNPDFCAAAVLHPQK